MVSINLHSPIFAHGQLYMALLRTTDVRKLLILFPPETREGITQNIWYPEVVQFLSTVHT